MILKKIKRFILKYDNTRDLYLKLRYTYSKFRLNIPDEQYAQEYYFKRYKRKLDLKHPITFDDKIWWLKFNYHNKLMTQCADKLAVRDYVKKCGLGHILNDLYEVYDSVDKINIQNLPNRFYLKCNHVSGGNVACYDKNKFNLNKAKNRLTWYIGINQYYITREWQYKDIIPKIIAERYLENTNKNPLVDYKIYCFHGEPKVLLITSCTAKSDGSHQEGLSAYENYYDIDLKPLGIIDDSRIMEESDVVFPKNYKQMLEYAMILSKPFPFVRVDFYEVNSKVIFGELTFTCAGGCHDYKPEKYNKIFGDYLDLSKIRDNNLL